MNRIHNKFLMKRKLLNKMKRNKKISKKRFFLSVFLHKIQRFKKKRYKIWKNKKISVYILVVKILLMKIPIQLTIHLTMKTQYYENDLYICKKHLYFIVFQNIIIISLKHLLFFIYFEYIFHIFCLNFYILLDLVKKMTIQH